MVDQWGTPDTPDNWGDFDAEVEFAKMDAAAAAHCAAAGEDMSAELAALRLQCWRWRILYALAFLAIWGALP